MSYFFYGIVSWFALAVLTTLAACAGARLGARLFRVPSFRWFDSSPMDAPLWRRAGVRMVSSIAPLALAVALFWAGGVLRGDSVPTTNVTVSPGAAQRAGMRDGDRIVSIDGRPLQKWDQIRTALRERGGERRIEVARAGERKILLVTPDANLRIGVKPIQEDRAVGIWEGLGTALRMPFVVLGSLFQGAISAPESKVELSGPVGLVHQVAKSPRGGSMLWFLALLSAFYWPIALGIHVFDAATLALFLRIVRTRDFGAEADARRRRLMRWRHALILALGCAITLGCVQLLGDEANRVSALAAASIALAIPPAVSLYPLIWLMAAETGSRREATGMLAASLLVPCLAAIAAIVLLVRAGRELNAAPDGAS